MKTRNSGGMLFPSSRKISQEVACYYSGTLANECPTYGPGTFGVSRNVLPVR